MRYSLVGSLHLLLFATLLGWQTSSLADEPAEKSEEEGSAFVVDNVELKIVRVGEGAEGYWIGVGCESLDAEARAKLKLEGEHGLRITEVVPKSPAAKVKLREGDVILAVGDAKIASQEQLAKIVLESNGKPLNLTVLREGKSHHFKIKPENRPAEQGFGTFSLALTDPKNEGEKKEVKKQKEAREKKPAAKEETSPSDHVWKRPAPDHPQSRSVHPAPHGLGGGMFGNAPPGMHHPGMPGVSSGMAGPMHPPTPPDDMEITISKRGNRPAIIKVKQGEKSWKTTENELDMLPGEARGYVGRLLNKPHLGRLPGMQPVGPGASGATMPHGIQVRIHAPGEKIPPHAELQKQHEQAVREIREKIEQHHKEIEAKRKELEAKQKEKE